MVSLWKRKKTKSYWDWYGKRSNNDMTRIGGEKGGGEIEKAGIEGRNIGKKEKRKTVN